MKFDQWRQHDGHTLCCRVTWLNLCCGYAYVRVYPLVMRMCGYIHVVLDVLVMRVCVYLHVVMGVHVTLRVLVVCVCTYKRLDVR
jgi:hypothetical protein